jgi:hypothetical protein
MPTVDAGVVFLPRLTTLVGATTFSTAPLDVSQQGGAQFQVWRGPIRLASGSGTLTLFLEESLDCQAWGLGPATPQGITIPESATQFFSYDFRLRWFRLRFVLAGTAPMVSCWAEGILRGGEGGLWGQSTVPVGAAGVLGVGDFAGGASRQPSAEDPWDKLRAMYAHMWDQGDMAGYRNQRSLELMRRSIDAAWRASHGGAAPPPAPFGTPNPNIVPGGMGMGPGMVQTAMSPPQIVYPNP